MSDQEQALATLQKLLGSGALTVIKSGHRCQPGFAAQAAKTPEQQAACDAYAAETGYTVYDPRHFESSTVVALVGPDDKGRYKAVAEDKSFVIGYPVALLKRLMQYAMAG